MQRRLLLAAGITSAAALAGCAGPQIGQYAGEKPVLDLRSYFNGTLDAYGVFTDRSGAVVKRFTVVMVCSWNGDDGVLDETFNYSDGSTGKRIWRMKHLGDGRFSGTADDVVGVARGEQRGNAFRWGYTLLLPVGGKPSDAGPPQGASAPSGGSEVRAAPSVGASIIEVQFDDWMYLVDQRVMLNKAAMSKFGVRLGEVTLSFVKRAP
ncbi:DUF3833 domain-containing protein [Hydrogenophaga sp.]|uniref:DUF3833 domain-containing protein n=1 Tax=Hydrogenophaga sp. TaxID=1904254 RepID=UPI002FCA77F2